MLVIEQNVSTFLKFLFSNGIRSEVEHKETAEVLIDGDVIVTISLGIYNKLTNQIFFNYIKDSDFIIVYTFKEDALIDEFLKDNRQNSNFNFTFKNLLQNYLEGEINFLEYLNLDSCYILYNKALQASPLIDYLLRQNKRNLLGLPVISFVKIPSDFHMKTVLEHLNSIYKNTNDRDIYLVDCDIITLTYMTIYNCTFYEYGKYVERKLSKVKKNDIYQYSNDNSQMTYYCDCKKPNCVHKKLLDEYIYSYYSIHNNMTKQIRLNNFLNKLNNYIQKKQATEKHDNISPERISESNIEQQLNAFIKFNSKQINENL